LYVHGVLDFQTSILCTKVVAPPTYQPAANTECDTCWQP